MPTIVVSQSIDPIKTSRLGAVLLLRIVVSSVFPLGYPVGGFGDLSVRLRDATYFATRTKQETRMLNMQSCNTLFYRCHMAGVGSQNLLFLVTCQ